MVICNILHKCAYLRLLILYENLVNYYYLFLSSLQRGCISLKYSTIGSIKLYQSINLNEKVIRNCSGTHLQKMTLISITYMVVFYIIEFNIIICLHLLRANEKNRGIFGQ